MGVSPLRVRAVNDAPPAVDGDYVLYWMIAFRRSQWNHALQRAVEWCRNLRKPLVVLEALRVGYPWASDRMHRFVIDGMVDNAAALHRAGVVYYPYVEPQHGAGSGLLESLAERAAVVVTDDFPCFFLPRMVAAAAARLKVRTEAVDANGMIPLLATDKAFSRAFDFRRWLQKNIRPYLDEDQFPEADPLHGVRLPVAPKLETSITARWPKADLQALVESDGIAQLPIDHAVPIAPVRGGSQAAARTLTSFLDERLARYGEERSDPDADAASGLSPYLHFGHIAAQQVFAEAMRRAGWSLGKLSTATNGQKDGWWGVSPALESFLDELITWRELGYVFCVHHPEDYDHYDSLPEWAQSTLAKHARDKREHIYSLAQFAACRTHDPLWNAAQRQLVREGRMQNYLRMLWGKKILEWTASPQEALAVMIELNNKYALDGRNPNSYSGIFWVLGRYDRPWAPERPVFGTIRFMSSENTARKLRLKEFLRRYGAEGTLFE